MRQHVLVARLDNAGDVLLSGPAVRAVAASGARVHYLCGPRGAAAARLLPGVEGVTVHRAPWIDPEPDPVDRRDVLALAEHLARLALDEAIVLTSFHQSPLPTALVLRLAGVPRVSAISVDYPGSLLDVRHRVPDDLHEVERALSLCAAAGYELPAGDDGRLAVRLPPPPPPLRADGAGLGGAPYVVVHPGASVPARAWHPDRAAALVRALASTGWRVVVTGGPSERPLTAHVAGEWGADLGGRTDLAELARVLAGARAVVVGNTGPAHLAAAVGTPVVSLYAPTVPARRWAPWRVPHVLLGDQEIGCAGCRARTCPVPGHPCLEEVDTQAVVEALALLGVHADAGATGAGVTSPEEEKESRRVTGSGGRLAEAAR